MPTKKLPDLPPVVWAVIVIAGLVLLPSLLDLILPALFAVAVWLLLKPYSKDKDSER